MKKLKLGLLVVFFLNSFNWGKESPFKYFFHPRPITTFRTENKSVNWDFKPIVQIPAIKITGSSRENAKLDASFLASAGGGISYQRTIVKNDKNYCTFSTNLIVLLNGDTSRQDAILDISPAITFGFLNNIIQVGGGIDLGTVENRGRLFGLLSAGFNITNN